MVDYHLRIVALTLVFVLGMCGKTNPVRIQAPVPPLYQDAREVDKIEDPDVHITSYITNAKPDAIFTFYHTSLTDEGWQRRTEGTDQDRTRYAGYDILTKGPAFALLIRAKVQNDGTTRVELKQTISGPFSWPEEP